MAHADAIEHTAHSGFQPGRPWDTVFAMAIAESSSKWWTREFERPAQLVLTHIASLDSMLGGDVEMSSSRLLGTANPSVAQRRPDPPPRMQQPSMKVLAQHAKTWPDARGNGNTGKKSRQPMHALPDGSLGTNMKGTPLCTGFQSGQCTSTRFGSLTCMHTESMHQCSKCLSPDHGSKFPHPCNRDQKKDRKGKGGKGKGKGKW